MKRGFTLIELPAVILILIALIAIPQFTNVINNASKVCHISQNYLECGYTNGEIGITAFYNELVCEIAIIENSISCMIGYGSTLGTSQNSALCVNG